MVLIDDLKQAHSIADIPDIDSLVSELGLGEEAERHREWRRSVEFTQGVYLMIGAAPAYQQTVRPVSQGLTVLSCVNEQPVSIVAEESRQYFLKYIPSKSRLRHHRALRAVDRAGSHSRSRTQRRTS